MLNLLTFFYILQNLPILKKLLQKWFFCIKSHSFLFIIQNTNMENLSLNADIRSWDEKLRDIRTSKKLPAVVYGHSQKSISITLDYSEFLKTFRKSWESHIISLNVDHEKIDVLVHDFQKEPVSWDFIHVDFYAVTKWEKVHTHIHLEFIWNSPAVKEWAILEEHIKELEVKCLPSDLVDSFKVNLETLKAIGDSIRVSDLNIDSKKYNILTNHSDIIVSATKPAKLEVVAEATTESK